MIYILTILVIAAFIAFVYVQSSGYDIVEYDLHTDKNIESTVSFVMLSDLHDTDVTHDGNKKLIESIDKINPDFVILAGDMITSYSKTNDKSNVTFDFLKELSGKYKVYYGK